MNEKKLSVLASERATIGTLVEVNEHVCLLDYQADYNLEAMLAAGSKSLLGVCRSFQKIFGDSQIMLNPARGNGGCSTFNTRTPEGDVIMGRNFDLKEGRCLAIWTHPKDGYASLSMCDQNLLAYFDVRKSRAPLRLMAAPYVSMDGVNEKGLAAAILEIKTKSTKQNTGKTPITTSVALRGVLDTCATVDEAVAFMERYDMHDLLMTSYHYQFTDAQGASAIVEYPNNKMYVHRQDTAGESLQLTNFFLSPEGDNSHAKGRGRYELIESTLAESPEMSERDAMRLLAECEVYYRASHKLYMVGTLWSSVYNCAQRTMRLCAGHDYERQYRLSLDTPCVAVPVEGFSNEGRTLFGD